ncbi:MAG: low affinity iron permease family protein [Candidatus Eisenbacteria bacterium]
MTPTRRNGAPSSRAGTRRKSGASWMERLSGAMARWTGSTAALASAFVLVLAWLLSGPFFDYSDTWQLAINTTTTIVTFLMVFMIQRAQNKDARATALKLNEVIAAIDGASNRMIDIEDLSEAELKTLHEHFRRLVTLAKKDHTVTQSHSIEEAETRHRRKAGAGRSSA